MGFHSMLVQVTWVGVMLTTIMAAAAIAYPLALPDCSDSCGDVEIPYPFGTIKHIFNKFLTYILCYNTFHVSFWFQQSVIAFGYCTSQLLLIDFFFNFFFTITDINECVFKDLNNCKSNQDCINEPGSYRCSCIGGYHPDGEACIADQPAPKSSLAINLTVGKYI